MDVSAVSDSSSPNAQTEWIILALRKMQDAQRAQEQGLLQLIQQAAPAAAAQRQDGVGTLINVSA